MVNSAGAKPNPSLIPLIACFCAGLTLWLAPSGLDPRVHAALAISAFMVLAWITHALDHAVTGLIGCFAFWALGVASFQSAFVGFADTTTWFLFGALLFGEMATKSGLARRLAFLVMRALGHTYSRLLLGLILSDFLLTLIVPSGIARVVIMAAIAVGLCDAFGLGRGTNVGRGMFIILVYTATIFDKMIIAGAASITARGLIEKMGGVEVLWGQWFLAFLPCDLITILVAWRLTIAFYPPEKPELPEGERFLREELSRMGRWSPLERRSALLMATAIALWTTDFLHRIPPPMVGLGVGLLATLPRIGVLDADDVRRINCLPVFFVASAIGMGHVLVQTGALQLLTDVMFGWMTPFISGTVLTTVILYWTAVLYHIPLGDEVSMLATSIPILMNFAKMHALDPLMVGMVWTFGAGGKIFVYQSAVLVVGYSYGYFTGRDLLKIGSVLTVVESVVVVLLATLYWPLIGI